MSDALKVLKIAQTQGQCELRTSKYHEQPPINHKMHQQVHSIFCLLYCQQCSEDVSIIFDLEQPVCAHTNEIIDDFSFHFIHNPNPNL